MFPTTTSVTTTSPKPAGTRPTMAAGSCSDRSPACRNASERAATGVHEQRGLLHLLEMRLLHQMVRVLGAGRMHGDDVGALQQLVVADRLHVVLAHHQLLDVGIVSQHLEAERLGAFGDGARHM